MILVTGASGFVGRSLMRALERSGREARAYSGHINDALTLQEELQDAGVVIHLASAEARGRVRALRQVDVQGTERILRECRRAEVQHFVILSRLNADPNSLYPLLRTKGQVEKLARQSTVPTTILRSATLFGREDRLLNVIASLAAWTWPFVWLPGGGTVALQPLWVEDLVRCLLLVLERPDLKGETVTVAGEERMRYAELVQRVLRAADMNRAPLKLDLRLVRPLALLAFGWWPRPPVTRFFMDRFTVPDVAPFDSVLRAFGFRPGRVDDHIAYLRRPGLRRALFRL